MLFGIPAGVPADLLHVLAAMGHGDELVVSDANFPAASTATATTHGRLIELVGREAPEAMADILSLMPLDAFDDAPVVAMAVPGEHERLPAVQAEVSSLLSRLPGSPWLLSPLDRFEFYSRARQAYAVVRTLERRPYGCFILKKGVLTPDGRLMTPDFANRVDDD